jgi:hypothetical protein
MQKDAGGKNKGKKSEEEKIMYLSGIKPFLILNINLNLMGGKAGD